MKNVVNVLISETIPIGVVNECSVTDIDNINPILANKKIIVAL